MHNKFMKINELYTMRLTALSIGEKSQLPTMNDV